MKGPGLLAVLLLAGCAGRDYQAPTPPAPATWSATATNGIAITRWWTAFRDPALDALLERVLAANLDVRLAAERLREARAALGVAEAGYGPTVNATAGASRSQVSGNGSLGPRVGGIGNLYQAGFDASWELDVFGGVRRNVEAAEADLAALEESRRDVLVSVCAETVRAWLDWRAAEARRDCAGRSIDNAHRQAALTAQRHRSGLADDVALAAAAVAVAQAEAALPPLATAARQAQDRLTLLAGATPGTDLALPATAGMPVCADIFALGLPADLVRQRPDLRRAERELAAATARIGVAEADLYPRISLTGGFGQQSTTTGAFTDAGSTYWSIGPAIRWPIFSTGRIRNQIKAADSRAEQAALRFEQACLRAYAEVEDALVALANDRQREERLVAATAARTRQLAIQQDRQRNGLADGLAVLRAEADHLAALDQMLAARRTSGTDLAALAKSLGGGWE